MKNKEKIKVAIIGHAAIGKEYYDGQTVSTRLWIEQFKKNDRCTDVMIVDTYNYKKRPVQILWNYFRSLVSCEAIIIILSGNGLRFFLPLLYYSNKIFKKKVFHRAIGGNMDSFITNNPKYALFLNSLEVNWVQSNRLVEKIADLGVMNGEYLENFREITPISVDEIQSEEKKPFKFCTFCRVSKAKGISDAICSISQINRDANSIVATLDVYGPMEDDYKEEFEQLVKENKECVRYMGCVESKNAVSVLKNYYMHLFPTQWRGEGFPGTLIDCYNSALPTIASDWAYNAEFIQENRTGFLYHWENPNELTTQIKKAINLSADDYKTMRLNNLYEAQKYTASYVMRKVITRMTQ